MTRSLVRISVLVAVSHAALSASSLDQARACSQVLPEDHVVDADEEAVDHTPPEVPVVGDVTISRGSEENGCSGGSSCGSSGSVSVIIDASVDDRTPEAEMGYVIELAGGELPSNMTLPDRPIRADWGWLGFGFGSHGQAIDFTLSIRAMDLGGNLSEPAMVRVSDGGVMGCSAGERSGSMTMILVILALAFAVRRRRDAFRHSPRTTTFLSRSGRPGRDTGLEPLFGRPGSR